MISRERAGHARAQSGIGGQRVEMPRPARRRRRAGRRSRCRRRCTMSPIGPQRSVIDDRQAAGHGLIDHRAARIVERRQDEDVGHGVVLRQVGLIDEAGEVDVAGRARCANDSSSSRSSPLPRKITAARSRCCMASTARRSVIGSFRGRNLPEKTIGHLIGRRCRSAPRIASRSPGVEAAAFLEAGVVDGPRHEDENALGSAP